MNTPHPNPLPQGERERNFQKPDPPPLPSGERVGVRVVQGSEESFPSGEREKTYCRKRYNIELSAEALFGPVTCTAIL